MKNLKHRFLILLIGSFSLHCFSATIDTLSVYPNPFHSVALIQFDLSQPDTISLDIYNKWGYPVKTFFHDSLFQTGSYNVSFQADSLPSDSYFVVLRISSKYRISRMIIKAALSINDNNENKQDIFPNPTNGLLTIPYKDYKIISITDIKGRFIKEIKNNSNIISLLDLINGTYILTIITDSGEKITRQIIKMNNYGL